MKGTETGRQTRDWNRECGTADTGWTGWGLGGRPRSGGFLGKSAAQARRESSPDERNRQRGGQVTRMTVARPAAEPGGRKGKAV